MENATGKVDTEKKRKPPYGAMQWYENLFALLKRVQLDRVDSKVLESNNITSGDNVYAVINGLKFLDLVDDKGTATPKMLSLRVMGEEYNKNFQKIVTDAYADLLSKVDIEKALLDDIANNFINHYDMPRSTALQAAKIFVFLAQKAGMPLSQELIKGLTAPEPSNKKVGKSSSKSESKKRAPKPEIGSGIPEGLAEEVLGRFTVKGVGYVDIKDKDTLELAKVYMQLLSKRLGDDSKASSA